MTLHREGWIIRRVLAGTRSFQIFIVWGSIIGGLNVENCAGVAVKNDAI